MRNNLPAGSGLTANAEYLPAYGVGGDFYSVAPTEDGRAAVAIGDVSGSGVSAALVMARVSAELQRALGTGRRRPAGIMSTVNAGLYELDSETFVTAACLHLDTRSRTLIVANAGHLPIVLRRASGEVFTGGHASGTPLGMFPSTYEDEELPLEPADIVLLATDGVLEALDRPGGADGLARLIELVRAAPHDAALLSESIRAVVNAQASGMADDATWVALQLEA
jgi:serine phosphatase RsbU (regulator of sigma subunit)